MMLGVTWINSQVVFDGLIQGLALSVITFGIILIYRASRIINFAVGNMGVIGATLLALLVVQYHVPFWVALPVALVTGLALGAIVDATVIRRLRKSPRCRPGRHHRHCTDRRGDRLQAPAAHESQSALPECDQRGLDGGRRAGTRIGPLDPDHRPRGPGRPDLVPRPDHHRPDGQGLRQQPPAGPAVRHQPEICLDLGLGAGRRALHPFDRPDRGPVWVRPGT